MDPQVQASFIPKKPLDTGSRIGRGGVGLFFILAFLIFIASLAAAAGAYLYTGYLNTALASKSQDLEKAQGAYDPAVIQDLMRLNSRINQGQILLNRHIAASSIFSFLSLHTLEKVSFSNFDYTLTTKGGATISMAGHADSFATVALQSDELGSLKVLKDVVFSGITVGDKNAVSFSVTATIDPSLLLYTAALGISPASGTTTAATSTSSTNSRQATP